MSQAMYVWYKSFGGTAVTLNFTTKKKVMIHDFYIESILGTYIYANTWVPLKPFWTELRFRSFSHSFITRYHAILSIVWNDPYFRVRQKNLTYITIIHAYILLRIRFSDRIITKRRGYVGMPIGKQSNTQ